MLNRNPLTNARLTRAFEIARNMLQRQGRLAPGDAWMLDDLPQRLARLIDQLKVV
jgi:hypothetical protein